MGRTLRTLLLSALLLLAAGSFFYHRDSQLNLEAENPNQMLWNQAPGDKWLYAGGVMILIAGALIAAAVKVWRGSRRQTRLYIAECAGRREARATSGRRLIRRTIPCRYCCP